MAASKRTKSWLLAVCALALTLLPAVASSAAPDRSATLDADNPTFTWESVGTGAPDLSGFVGTPALRCSETAPFDCEYVLLEVAAAGELTVTLDSTDGVDSREPTGAVCGDAPCGPGLQDLDGYVYESNAAGHPIGATLTTDCATFATSETCTVTVEPGLYVVEVELFTAVEAPYVGTAELVPAPPTDPPTEPPAEPQTITLEGCSFTLYYFKDSAERLRALVPEELALRGYPSGSPLVTEGSATIAAAAYDCDLVEVPGSPPAPAIFTVLSVLVYPPDGVDEGPAASDFYVLWVHADNAALVDLLASRGMPAHHVPGMTFEKPLLSLGVRVAVPWSAGAFELGATGYHQDVVHAHDNTFVHVTEDGHAVRMDFLTSRARDHYCFQVSDDHDVQCGHLDAAEGSPVAGFFGHSHRTAHNAWDHDPLQRSWFVLQ